MTTIVYLGNFDPPHSTENEVRKALIALGHDVLLVQENQPKAAAFPGAALAAKGCKDQGDKVVVLWTRTGWDWSYYGATEQQAHDRQTEMLMFCKAEGIPTVGYHLDRWWGLSREHLVHSEPFFRVDLLCTADGGHQAQWEAIGVNHVWFPPAVSKFECELGEVRREYHSDVCFVGSWRPGYHKEWTHRAKLVEFLTKLHRDSGLDVKLWPLAGAPAVRGESLRDLYASSRVVVGDSCLVPTADGPMTRYCSDRVPETLGRGGFLLHPDVEGITGSADGGYTMYEDREHLVTWPLNDFAALRSLIEEYAMDDRRRISIAQWGADHTYRHHTYHNRMERLFEELEERNLL